MELDGSSTLDRIFADIALKERCKVYRRRLDTPMAISFQHPLIFKPQALKMLCEVFYPPRKENVHYGQ